MMTYKRLIFFSAAFISTLFAHPYSVLLSAIAFFIGYPVLLHLIFNLNGPVKRGRYLYGFGLLYFLIQMRWMAQAQYHGSMIIPAYVLLSLIFAVPYFILGYCLPKTSDELSFRSIFGLSVLFGLMEYSRLFILCGFPFHTVGLVLASHVYSLQLASIIGLYGLSVIVIGFALFGARAIRQKNYSQLNFAFIPVFLGGLIYFFDHVSEKETKSFDVAVLQTGLRVEQKWDLPKYEGEFISDIDQIKLIWNDIKNLPPRDLIILPEASLPGEASDKTYSFNELKSVFEEDVHPFLKDHGLLSLVDLFKALSLYLNTDILVGLIDAQYNSAFYFSRGEVLGRYDKRRLVVFGEYIPFKFLRSLASNYGLVDSFKPGKAGKLFYGKFNILPTICFDEGFPEDFLSKVSMKPDVHVNLTNDAWFPDSSLIKDHMILGVVRSVENGLFSIRSCNTGISAIITPNGEVISQLSEKNDNGVMKRGVIVQSISLYGKKPLFLYLGNLRLLLISLALFTLLYVLSRKSDSLKT